MAYSKFTYEKIEQELGIYFDSAHLFQGELPDVPIDDWLTKTLEMGKPFATLSEKARSENLVHPILMYLCTYNQYQFSVYSGIELNVDAEQDLNGECDFMLAKGEPNPRLNMPLFCLIEAKDQDIKRAVPQCVAQLYAATLHNQKRGHHFPYLYGCVTTGETWCFLKLAEKTCWIDVDRYYHLQLKDLLGVLQSIVNGYK